MISTHVKEAEGDLNFWGKISSGDMLEIIFLLV